MTSLATTRYAAHLQPDTGSIAVFFSRFLRGVTEGWAVWQTFRMLSAMRDDQLAQLGIKREDCGRVAMFGQTPG